MKILVFCKQLKETVLLAVTPLILMNRYEHVDHSPQWNHLLCSVLLSGDPLDSE